MKKELYEILEISESATQKEIKKAFRKLAAEWHPDKWMSGDSEEKEKANKKMRKINKAYEILGDEEKRRAYDLEGTDFLFKLGGYDDIIGEYGRWRKELRGAREGIINTGQGLDRFSKINEISATFQTTYPWVFKEDLSKNLWDPYQDWREKAEKMEINELSVFKEEMIKAINEAKVRKQVEGQVKEKQQEKNVTSQIEKIKANAIEEIKGAMEEKGLKTEDLKKYPNLKKFSNYVAQINDLSEDWKIHYLRDEIKDAIDIEAISNVGHLKSKNNDWFVKNDYNERANFIIPPIIQNQNFRSDNREFGNQHFSTRGNEEWENQRLRTENRRLSEEVSQLKRQVHNLLEEINRLKENQSANIQIHKKSF